MMIGHSERRHTFHETDAQAEKKVRCALDHGFRVLLCVGEQAQERQYGVGAEVLRMQLKIGLHQVRAEETDRIWAEYVEEKHRMMRETLMELFGQAGARIPLLYGGSVHLDNAGALICCDAVDGLFVGRSAWDAARFDTIIRKALRAVL